MPLYITSQLANALLSKDRVSEGEMQHMLNGTIGKTTVSYRIVALTLEHASLTWRAC